MKKVFFIPAFVALFAFSSCQKCKECSCSQTVTQTGMADFQQTVELGELCGEDLEAVEGTTTFTQSVMGIEQSIEQTCTCD